MLFNFSVCFFNLAVCIFSLLLHGSVVLLLGHLLIVVKYFIASPLFTFVSYSLYCLVIKTRKCWGRQGKILNQWTAILLFVFVSLPPDLAHSFQVQSPHTTPRASVTLAVKICPREIKRCFVCFVKEGP